MVTLTDKPWTALPSLPPYCEPVQLRSEEQDLISLLSARRLGSAAAISAVWKVLQRIDSGGFSILRLGVDRWISVFPPSSPGWATALDIVNNRQSDFAVTVVDSVAIVTRSGPTFAARLDAYLLRQAANWLAMCIEIENATTLLEMANEEAAVQRYVASEILSIRDLDQVLLSISTQTLRLLDSDICGVFLREGDLVKMRSCVGHRMIETVNLQMRRGQGVAGMVFETGEIGRVDSYLTDQTISHDFLLLAEQENTRSALAVPLRSHGKFIGVLEVWRRRDSIFTDSDVRRMVALADLATIAIENATLYENQRRAVKELRETHDAMETQVGLLRKSSRLQTSLLRVILEGSGAFSSVVKTVAQDLGCTVVFSAADGTVISAQPFGSGEGEIQVGLTALAHSGQRSLHSACRRELPSGRRWWTHPVVVAEDEIGTISLIDGSEPDDVMEVAAGQAAMACSLAHLEQRAASQARNAAFDQIVWDLMDGPVEHRRAAIGRAREMGIQLSARHRIIHGAFTNLGELAHEQDWDTATVDRSKRTIFRALKASPAGHALKLLSLRGDWIVAVAEVDTRTDTRELVSELTRAAGESLPGIRMYWGVSSPCDAPLEYPSAFREAQTALSGARRLRTVTFSLYDELGIVRLLLGSTGESPDLQQFIDDVTKPLADYDRQHDGSLLMTLRAFFDSDCSQKRAAEMLFVHPKTLRYRLDQIAELSGLDLSVHADRMRADLALRLLEVSASNSEG